MKKTYFLLILVLVIFNSCSSDSSDTAAGGVLLKKIQNTSVSSFGDTDTYTIEYFYNGNKINRILFDGNTETIFTYTGDLITYASQGYVEGDMLLEETYQYDNQERVIAVTTHDNFNDDDTLKIYTYNSDNTITQEIYNGTTANPAYLTETGKYVLDNLNRFTIYKTFINGNWVNRIAASYTNYYSPLRNVTGLDKVTFTTDADFGFHTFAQYLEDGSTNNSSVFDYTVNATNYPTQRIQTLSNSDGSSTVVTSNYSYY